VFSGSSFRLRQGLKDRQALKLVGGLGARLSRKSLGILIWLAIGNGIIIAAYLMLRSPNTLTGIATKGRLIFLFGGGASFVAYAIVIWAFTQAPIALGFKVAGANINSQ